MKRKISNKQLAEALYQITRGLKKEGLTQALRSFVTLLMRFHKLKQARRVIDEFIRYSKKQEGIVEIEVTTARNLDDGTMLHIKKAFGTKVEEESVVDENILGGVKIKTGDKILDASLKTQLINLKRNLAN
jgi:F-type H+-transporting ATPase subunit delta